MQKGGEEDTFRRAVTDAAIHPLIGIDKTSGLFEISLVNIWRRRRRILSVKEGESRRTRSACDTLPGPTCESESEEGYFQ